MKHGILSVIFSMFAFVFVILIVSAFLKYQENISTIHAICLCSLSVSFMGVGIGCLAAGLAELGGNKNENK